MSEGLTCLPGPGNQLFRFIDDDAQLPALVARYIGTGLAAREPALVITTPARWAQYERELGECCIDVDRARKVGTILVLDLQETMEAIFVDDMPDRARFLQTIGGAVSRLRKSRQDVGVRVFGEIVDALWKRGNIPAAIELQRLWSDLSRENAHTLLCAFSRSFTPEAYRDAIDASFAEPIPASSRSTELSRQQHRAMEAELEHRLGLERARRAQHANLEDTVQKLDVLVRLSTMLHSELDLDVLMQKLTDEARVICGAGVAAFCYNVADDKGGAYALYTLSGASRESFGTIPMPRNTKIFEPTFQGTGIVRSDDITLDPRFGKNEPFNGMPLGHVKVRSYLAIPVKSRSGNVLGGLFLGHADAGVFDESDERTQIALGLHAAIAIENARLLRDARRAVEELERADRTKDEFLATISHELRTSLHGILGWVRMLRTGTLSEERRVRALETVERNAKAQAQHVEDLLDVSRIISGKLRLAVTSVYLPTVVDSAIEAVRTAAAAKGVTVQQTVDPSVGPILADAARLQQILWNLLSNAVKFTPKGGRIHVAVQRHESSLETIVSDNGQGIEPALLPYVFNRFFQADGAHTRKHGGPGLGLASTRHLVELHGGQLRVESAGLGKGATFVFRIPVSPLRQAPIERAVRVTPVPMLIYPPELVGVHALVLEDDEDIRDLLVQVLAPCKGITATAATVVEALRYLERHQPDVIISDIGLPREDGYSFIRKLRAMSPERGGKIPAIALTADARVEDRTKALTAGFHLHLPKPVEPAELLAVLSSLATFFPRG